MKRVMLLLCFLTGSQLSFGAVIHVPSGRPTIQGGIDAAVDGDTVQVLPGTYIENINFHGKGVLLTSTGGRDSTSIQPANPDSAIVIFVNGEDTNSVINGFSISGTASATGIVCQGSSPVIRNCEISNCTSPDRGGGISCLDGGVKIRHNDLHDNDCSYSGGAIYFKGFAGTPVEITDNLIYGHMDPYSGPVVGSVDIQNAMVARNIVRDNYNGIYVNGIDCSVFNNTVTDNSYGILIGNGIGSSVKNNIAAWNSGEGIRPVHADMDYNCVWENGDYPVPGPNSIEADPLFYSLATNDFSLRPGSPCIDAGDPDPQFNDPDGSRNDMGAIPFCMHNFPIAFNIQYGPNFLEEEVRSPEPVIYWSYFDTIVTSQTIAELEIGTDLDWESAEMWTTGTVFSSDTIMVYSGLPLSDHAYYYLRIRVSNGSTWGDWKQFRFRTRFSSVVEVPEDKPTIQSAIDYSFDGDTVLVGAGTYIENISFRGKAICVIGKEGAENTHLQPEYPDSMTVAIYEGYFNPREFSDFSLSGSVAQNTIRIADNSFAIIRDCIFRNNANSQCVLYSSSANEILRNVFYENTGGYCIYHTHPDYGATIVNNTLVENEVGVGGQFGAFSILKNNIIVNSTGCGVEIGPSTPFAVEDYNNVWNNNPDFCSGSVYDPGENDISGDPLFADPADHDFKLQEESPCVDSGDPNSQYSDPDGTRSDMGAFYHDYNLANPYEFNLGPEDITHVVSHTLTFYWTVPDTFPDIAGFEVQVGTDNDWTVAEMWATGPIWEKETSIEYAGLSLEDGATYYSRLRLHSGSDWGSYDMMVFSMNSEPAIPIPLSPTGNANVPANLVRLIVQNVSDAQSDPIKYDFEVYLNSDTTDMIAMEYGVEEQTDSTISSHVQGLQADRTYYWRSRASDGYEYSGWSELDSFTTASVNVLLVPMMYPTIQDAIDASVDGDSVLVASGTYMGTGNTGINFNGKLIKLVSESGAASTIIDCEESASRGFMFDHGETDAGVVRGFTIKNAIAGIELFTSSPTISECVFAENSGSGITCHFSSPYIEACSMLDNDGPGMLCYGSSPSVVNSHFISNVGGISCFDSGHLKLDGCNFTNNTAGGGGAIYTKHPYKLVLSDCVFDGNSATAPGIGVGGAIGMELGDSLILNRCSFIENSAAGPGAAINLAWGYLHATDCLFRSNHGLEYYYGIITIDEVSPQPKFTRCIFENNDGDALLMFLHQSSPRFDSCLFTGNEMLGPLVYGGSGSAVFMNSSTMSGNTAGERFGLIEAVSAPVFISNSILSFNSCPVPVLCHAGIPAVECSDIYGNSGGDWVGDLAGLQGMNGNISLDPQFCDTVSGDYNIHENSPCAPDNNECGLLIGACDVACMDYLCGDADGSGDVDIDDVVFLIRYIFSGGPAPDPLESGDDDCSGAIDIDDVVYLIAYIFTGGPPPCDPNGDEVPDC